MTQERVASRPTGTVAFPISLAKEGGAIKMSTKGKKKEKRKERKKERNRERQRKRKKWHDYLIHQDFETSLSSIIHGNQLNAEWSVLNRLKLIRSLAVALRPTNRWLWGIFRSILIMKQPLPISTPIKPENLVAIVSDRNMIVIHRSGRYEQPFNETDPVEWRRCHECKLLTEANSENELRTWFSFDRVESIPSARTARVGVTVEPSQLVLLNGNMHIRSLPADAESNQMSPQLTGSQPVRWIRAGLTVQVSKLVLLALYRGA